MPVTLNQVRKHYEDQGFVVEFSFDSHFNDHQVFYRTKNGGWHNGGWASKHSV